MIAERRPDKGLLWHIIRVGDTWSVVFARSDILTVSSSLVT